MDLKIHPPLPQRKDFRIGVIGSGFIVNDCHLVAYRKAGFNPVAIASRTKEKAAAVAQRRSIPKVHDTPEQLLDDPSIEVLDIAVPPNAQLGVIKAACARRSVKGILAQKPLAVNYREAVEAVLACEAAGITLAVNQNMRYDQSVRAGKTLLENGTIGEPVLATIDMRGIPHWMPWQAELGWVTLRIMSIHHLDCFRYWFGDPERIFCSVRPDPRTKFPHTDGICTYILEYPSGLRCVSIDDVWTGPAKEGCPADIDIRWRIEGLDGLAIGDLGWCQNPYTTPSVISYATKGFHGFQCPVWRESWFPDAFIGTMAQLLVALESGREPAISGRDNLKTMALVEAAYRSVEEHRAVEPVEIIAEAGARAQQILPNPPDIPWPFGAKIETEETVRGGSGADLANYTPQALQTLALARREAVRLNHCFLGTEHLLLGLVALAEQLPGEIAGVVLRRRGLEFGRIREEILTHVGAGPPDTVSGNIPYTPRVKKVLALAAKEARALSHTNIGTEHLLLGLLNEGDDVAARVLRALGLEIEWARQEILKELDPNRE